MPVTKYTIKSNLPQSSAIKPALEVGSIGDLLNVVEAIADEQLASTNNSITITIRSEIVTNEEWAKLIDQ